MPELAVRPLGSATWPDFAALVERHNGVWGGCDLATQPAYVMIEFDPVFIAEYAQYRRRQIVSFREVESYERKVRTLGERPRTARSAVDRHDAALHPRHGLFRAASADA